MNIKLQKKILKLPLLANAKAGKMTQKLCFCDKIKLYFLKCLGEVHKYKT